MSIFEAILAVVHWLLALTLAVDRLIKRLSSRMRPLMSIFGSSESSIRLFPLRKRLADVDKLPVHLSLVVVEDDISLVDIARLVAWSTAAGIAYVTIYDHRGECKEKRSLLHSKVVDERQRANIKVDYNCVSHSHNNERLLAHNGWCSLDSSIRTEPGVFVLGPDDGRQGLVEVARQLSCAAVMQRLVPTDISVSYVDTLIQGRFGFPDPDLVLKFGQVDSVLGFLPWQLRLSEIICLSTHRNVRLEQFIDALIAFGNTQQRFGK